MTDSASTVPMLEADQLTTTRGHTRLFADIALRVARREALLVTGPNGSGKTTLLRILAGLTAPSAGVIRFRGKVVPPFDPQRRDGIAFVGHLPALKDELSAVENLQAAVALAGAPPTTQRVNTALDRVQLSRQRALPARLLSQGQRRRIGLARLILVDKPLWILDEPTTALDREGITLLTSLLRQHLDANGCAIVATHQRLDIPRAATLSFA